MFIKFVDGTNLDSEFPIENNPNKSVEVTHNGVLCIRNDTDSTVVFHPWHTIAFVMADSNEGIRLSNEVRK